MKINRIPLIGARLRPYLAIFFVAISLSCSFAFSAPLPPAIETYFRRALDAFEAKDLKKSHAMLDALSKRYPNNALFHFNRGNVLLELKDFEGAAKAYERVIELRSPLAPAAKIFFARANRMRNAYAPAIRTLQELRAVSLPPALEEEKNEEIQTTAQAALKYGINYYDAGRYPESLAWINASLAVGAEGEIHEQALLMRGLTLYRMNRMDEAKREFSKLSNSVHSATIRESARSLLQSGGGVQTSSNFWASMDLSFGYDSNIFRDGESESLITSPISQLAMNLGVRTIKDGTFSSSLTYSLNWMEYFSQSSARIIQNIFAIPFVWESRKSWLSISPTFFYEFTLSSAYLMRIGAQISWSNKNRDGDLGLDYGIFRKNAIASQFEYLNGWTHELRFRRSFIGPKSFFMPWVSVTKETASDLQLSTGNLPIAALSYGPGFVWAREISFKDRSNWEFTLNGSYILSSFDSVSNPGNVKRSDQLLTLGSTLGVRNENRLKTYGGLTFLRNSSTLNSSHADDKNFTEWVAFLGVAWDIR